MTALRVSILAMVLMSGCSTVKTAERNPYAEHYLSDPETPDVIKAAIRQRVVIVGMCPHQAFAAAGEPGPYLVKRDSARWPEHSDPVRIIGSQCQNPDHSVIELMFRNASQFDSKDPLVFRVRFADGKAVLIDQKRFEEN